MSLKANAKSGVDGLDAAGELRMLPTHRKQRGAYLFNYRAMKCGGLLGAAFDPVVAPLALREMTFRRACRNPLAAERMKNRYRSL
jgi:hypothetical protein